MVMQKGEIYEKSNDVVKNFIIKYDIFSLDVVYFFVCDISF